MAKPQTVRWIRVMLVAPVLLMSAASICIVHRHVYPDPRAYHDVWLATALNRVNMGFSFALALIMFLHAGWVRWWKQSGGEPAA